MLTSKKYKVDYNLPLPLQLSVLPHILDKVFVDLQVIWHIEVTGRCVLRIREMLGEDNQKPNCNQDRCDRLH